MVENTQTVEPPAWASMAQALAIHTVRVLPRMPYPKINRLRASQVDGELGVEWPPLSIMKRNLGLAWRRW